MSSPEPKPMTGRDIALARRKLGEQWGLGRDITLGELGAVLRLAPASAWATVGSWEDGKREPSGPVRVAIELMLDGAMPRHLQDVMRPNNAGSSPRGPVAGKGTRWHEDGRTLVVERRGVSRVRGNTAEFARADRVVDEDGRVLKSKYENEGD